MLATALSPAEIYAYLEALVLPVLEAYQTDLTVHDRHTLSSYAGPFLLSYRPTGTNLLVLGPVREWLIAGDARPPAQQVQHTFDRKRAEIAYNFQTHFLHFDGQQFHPLGRAEALRVADEALGQTLAKLAAGAEC